MIQGDLFDRPPTWPLAVGDCLRSSWAFMGGVYEVRGYVDGLAVVRWQAAEGGAWRYDVIDKAWWVSTESVRADA